MSDDGPFALSQFATQQRRIMTDLSGLREDMQVMTAIVLRRAGTLSALLNEVYAMRCHHSRLANRVRDLEAR